MRRVLASPRRDKLAAVRQITLVVSSCPESELAVNCHAAGAWRRFIVAANRSCDEAGVFRMMALATPKAVRYEGDTALRFTPHFAGLELDLTCNHKFV